MEAGMISSLYGEACPRVIALKSWIGHGASACGAIELAIVLACMKEAYLPEIRNLTDPCSEKINFARCGENKAFDTVLLENFGFGGQNGALVLKRYDSV
jgi:3-oxoacyl-[acyl-carrier-protein] synthase II